MRLSKKEKARRMERLREDKAARGECRSCEELVANHLVTGKPKKSRRPARNWREIADEATSAVACASVLIAGSVVMDFTGRLLWIWAVHGSFLQLAIVGLAMTAVVALVPCLGFLVRSACRIGVDDEDDGPIAGARIVTMPDSSGA